MRATTISSSRWLERGFEGDRTVFVLNNDRCVWWPVQVEVPYDGGAVRVHEFDARFRLPPAEKKGKRAPTTPDSFEAARKVITDWRGVARAKSDDPDDPGEPLPFDEQALRLMLANPRVVQGLVGAYLECIAGVRRKNLPTPRDDGRAAAPSTTE